MTVAPDFQQFHLTEDQLDDHLIGYLAVSAAGHLAACSLCSERVAQAASPIASFRAVSLAWGERQSATAPMPSLSAAQNQWQRRLAWSMAILACAVGLGVANAHQRVTTSEVSQTAYTEQARTPSAEQISSDNQLLNTIDSEVGSSSENSATLGLISVNAPRPAATHATLIRTSVQD